MGASRLDEGKPSLDPIEAIVHSIEAQPHLRNVTGHMRDAALDGAEATALPALLFPNLAQLLADGAEVLKNQVRRFVCHDRNIAQDR